MTSTSAQIPSASVPAGGNESLSRSPIASLLQALGGPCAAASPESNGRADAKNFDLMLAPGSARAPRAVNATGSQAAKGMDSQALNTADATQVRGSWMALPASAGCGEGGAATDVAAVSEVEEAVAVESGGGDAQPLRSAVETAVAMMMGIIHSLPETEAPAIEPGLAPSVEGEVVDLAGAGMKGDTAAKATEVTVELPGEESFRVVVPGDAQSKSMEARLKAADRIAARQAPDAAANGAEHAFVNSRGARATEVLTALANGTSPAKSGKVEIPADLAVDAPEAIAATDADEAQPVESATVDAEIELTDGQKIRLSIKSAGAPPEGREFGFEKGGAEIASPGEVTSGHENSPAGSLKKTFLSVVDKHLASPVKAAGIGIAKSGANMSSQATLPTTSTLGHQSMADAVAGFDVGLVDNSGDYPDSTIDMVARRAMEMAINVIEAQAGARGRSTSTVNLRLRLAGEDVAIRVQLQKGEVRTSFHTSSPELREAISREWQIAAADSTQRVLHFHEPEFSNNARAFNDRGSFEPFNRGGNSAREQSEAHREAAVQRSFARRPSVEAALAPAAGTIRSFAPGSLHLSTFA